MKVEITMNGKRVIKLVAEDELEQLVLVRMLDGRAVNVNPLKHLSEGELGPAMLISSEK